MSHEPAVSPQKFVHKPSCGSLFSGIGAMDLGIERAGFELKWQVEIDPYCRRVLERHWPGLPRGEDVRTWPHADTERVDLLFGGFPCTDISHAGRREGIDGQKSGLWSEFRRIIRELRPGVVLVENVAALLGRGASRVFGDLAADGFDCEWACVPAAAVGAPHLRDRVFICAHSASGRQSELRRTQREDGQPDGIRASVANANGAGLAFGQVFSGNAREELTAFERGCSTGAGQWAAEPDVGRMADGVANRVDRLRGLGNGVVPQVAEWIGKRLMLVL